MPGTQPSRLLFLPLTQGTVYGHGRSLSGTAMLAQQTSGFPPLATGPRHTGLCSRTAHVLQMGCTCWAVVPTGAPGSGKPGRTNPPHTTPPPVQDLQLSLVATQAWLGPWCPLPLGTAASFVGTEDVVN